MLAAVSSKKWRKNGEGAGKAAPGQWISSAGGRAGGGNAPAVHGVGEDPCFSLFSADSYNVIILHLFFFRISFFSSLIFMFCSSLRCN